MEARGYNLMLGARSVALPVPVVPGTPTNRYWTWVHYAVEVPATQSTEYALEYLYSTSYSYIDNTDV